MNNVLRKSFPRIVLVTIAAVSSTGVARAQGFAVDWMTVDGGGVQSSAGGGYSLSGTIGQPDASAASAMTGGNYSLTGGFWVTMPACTSFAPADFDWDCDVDGADIQIFTTCAAGPAVALAIGCDDIDLDSDSDGDVDDLGVVQRCYSGENNPADPNCGD